MNSGRIEQYGTPDEVYQRPMTEYVAKFLGIRNRLQLTYDGAWASEIGPLAGDLSILGSDTTPLQLYARPTNLGLSRQIHSVTPRTLILPPARIKDASIWVARWNIYCKRMTLFFMSAKPLHMSEFEPGELVHPCLAHEDALLYRVGRLIGA